MARGRVRVTKLNPKPLALEVKEYLIPLKEKQLLEISEATLNEIRNNIRRSIQRPNSSGNLESSVFMEKILAGYGIGNVDYLNQNAPYWHWINYGIAQTGRRIPPSYVENSSIMGIFSPGLPKPDVNYEQEGRFQIGRTDNGRIYPLFTSKPIEPHNYIERTVDKIPAIINLVLSQGQ